jgi:hypothetical protein
MLSDQGKVEVGADVLTKVGILYKGRVSQYILGRDGALSSLILEVPFRFRRDEYKASVDRALNPRTEDFWARIPGRSFTILASDISTINLRHSSPKADAEIRALFEELLREAGR